MPHMKRLILLIVLILPMPVFADEVGDKDPWIGLNRKIYAFNNGLDDYIFTPLARTYQVITPRVVDDSITRFFSNLGDISNSANNLLQFKPGRALSDLTRFTLNSTIGIIGIFDVATPMGLKKSDEDFGQTLGVWGVPDGPYLILPVLGSSSARDAIGLLFDMNAYLPAYDPNKLRGLGLLSMDFIDTRADFLGSTRVMDTASHDVYQFERDVYLQRRLDEVYDGNPPVQEEDLDFLLEE